VLGTTVPAKFAAGGGWVSSGDDRDDELESHGGRAGGGDDRDDETVCVCVFGSRDDPSHARHACMEFLGLEFTADRHE
jgi:hypothetical protein